MTKIECLFYNGQFFMSITNGKLSFRIFHNRIKIAEMYIFNETETIYRYSETKEEWDYFIEFHLNNLNFNNNIHILLLDIIYSRKKWIVIRPLIVRLCELTYQYDINTKVYLLQNNFRLNSLSFIYNSEDNIKYNKLISIIKNYISKYIFSDILNLILKYITIDINIFIKNRICKCGSLNPNKSHNNCIKNNLIKSTINL